MSRKVEFRNSCFLVDSAMYCNILTIFIDLLID